MTVQDIYNIIDETAPFSTQESYDNAGLLVGDGTQEVRRILLTLDITIPVVEEAAKKGAELILSHHPVIWGGLKSVSPAHPVWHLIQHNISAICAHTNFDIAPAGLNTVIGEKMDAVLSFASAWSPLEQLSGGRTLGFCADLPDAMTTESLAKALAAVYTGHALRYYDAQKPIHRIAWCSGAGGDLIAAAIAQGADALVTGDCKHSVWAEAQNRSFTLFDCGHFETEVFAVERFASLLHEKAPSIETIRSEIGTQPFFQTIESLS